MKETIVQLLSNLTNPKEFNQYMTRFVDAGQSRFAVIKVGGAILINNLENRGIKSPFINGQRVTTQEVLKVAMKTFIEQNLRLANRLQEMGVKTSSLTSGVFTARPAEQSELKN